MEDLTPKETIILISACVSGFFGLIIAVVSWLLSGRRTRSAFRQELKLREYDNLKALYAEVLASFDKSVQYTKAGKDYAELIDIITITSAKAVIMAPASINDKILSAGQIMLEWHSEFKLGEPKRIGDSAYGVFSSEDVKHREKADRLYPLLTKEIYELASLIKEELAAKRKELVKKSSL